LTDSELRLVWFAADREAPKARAFIRLLTLTAAREAEVAGVTVGEINLAAARWVIPAARAKNRQALTVPLCGLALAELRAVWPTAPKDSTWHLLGKSGTAPFSGFSNVKERLDAATDLEPWRLHDLRRTARTGMTRLGVPRDHAEAAINHISGRSALERTYDRHGYADEVIAALERWQTHVAGLTKSEGDDHDDGES
jgi:integrase